MNLRFDLPWLTLAAVLLPLASACTFWLWHRRRLARLATFGTEAAVARLAPAGIRRAPVAPALRVSAALALGAFAIAGPRWGTGTTLVRTEGIDVVLAMDASLSMLAEDERPNRLERMKQEIRRFRAVSPGDRVALLAFAGRSYILSPLTTDDGAIDLFLDNLDPSIVGEAGTALAPTITQGVDLLRAARGAAGRALVVLSDGEAFDDRGATLAAARAARDAEIEIVTVGFGSEAGTTIPVHEGARVVAKRDAEGQMVITRYDPALLREVAGLAHGEFIAATETDKGTRIRQALLRLDQQQRDVAEGLSRPLRVTWFLLPAMLLLLLDAWRADGGSFRRLARILHLAAPALLVIAAPPAAHAQSAGGDAMLAFQAGNPLRAARLWRAQIARGDKRAVTLFNYGTAMLAADSLDLAAEALERAALSPETDLRQRALYNLGLAQLKRGVRGEGGDRRPMEAAIAAYRALLLQRSDDADAKWNYELALRLQRQQGGEGGDRNNQQSQRQQVQRQQPEEGVAMSRQQAEQLLSSAARDEKETQANRQRGARQERPAGRKDW